MRLQFPSGLSLSKPLVHGPFDKLRANGGEGSGFTHHRPFGLSLSKALHLPFGLSLSKPLVHGPVDKLRGWGSTPFTLGWSKGPGHFRSPKLG